MGGILESGSGLSVMASLPGSGQGVTAGVGVRDSDGLGFNEGCVVGLHRIALGVGTVTATGGLVEIGVPEGLEDAAGAFEISVSETSSITITQRYCHPTPEHKVAAKTGKFNVTMVNPWGCVMGIRTGNNWDFYLQENATVVCNIVTKTGVVQRYYARPMHIRQIYPNGGGVASMSPRVPVQIS